MAPKLLDALRLSRPNVSTRCVVERRLDRVMVASGSAAKSGAAPASPPVRLRALRDRVVVGGPLSAPCRQPERPDDGFLPHGATSTLVERALQDGDR
jgi:hypothetical protein